MDRIRGLHAGVEQWHGMARDEVGEIHGARIAFDDFNVPLAGKLQPQLRRQHAVEFNGDQTPRAGSQRVGERAASRADLDHRGVADLAQRFDDPLRRRGIAQEILPQPGALFRLPWFCHIDPFFTCHLN